MLAFGLSAYDDNREPIEDPSIGVVNSYYKSWSTEYAGVRWTPITTRDCTKAELHIRNETDIEES